jgi:hypothetical protein
MVEYQVSERWQHTSEVELFWDTEQRKLLFKKQKFLYSITLDTNTPNPYIDL